METKKLVTLDTELQFLEKEMEEIMGQWNGDESGMLEDRASVARDIKEKSAELRELLEELDESF